MKNPEGGSAVRARVAVGALFAYNRWAAKLDRQGIVRAAAKPAGRHF